MEASTKPCPECGANCIEGGQYCPYCGFPVGAVTSHREDQLIGKVLPGGYQVLELVGIGGMGRVYRAQQQALGRTVAVKVIHPHLLANENSLARFWTEARAMSHLNHPNSVSVIDFGKTSSNEPYLVMEFLRGNNLAQVQAAEGPLPIPRIVNVLRQVLMALGEAHAHQIIHRDLKPENIVLEPMRRGGDFVKVVDFGLAKLKAGPGTSITSPGIVCGTPDYMAPEQGRGDEIDGRSDLYAVGVVLFWLLTGRLPYEGNTPTQVVLMHIKNPIPDPRELVPQRNLPEPLVQIVYKALAKSPGKRYQDALEFADALENAAGKLVSEPPVPQVPNEFVKCQSCGGRVPRARFCYDCGARLPAALAPAARLSEARLPFVGREEEMSALHRAWGEAVNDRRALRIVGEAGAGKTRLLEEFASQVAESGARAIFARPDPYWAEIAGYTLRSMLVGLLPNESFDPAQKDPLLRYAFEELFGTSNNSDLSPFDRRRAFAHALQWAVNLAGSGQRRPLLLVVEDLDRVDGLTRQAIEDFLAEPMHCRVLLVGIHTPSLRLEWPNDEMRVLTGLSANLATTLLQRGSENAASFTLVEVGNRGIPPLYIEEALAFGLDGGSIPPARLADLIALRLAGLDPEARRYVQALAVLGEEVPETLLASMLSLTLINGSAVDGLIKDRLLKRNSNASLSLAHPLLQELSLHAIPAEVRRELHRRAGDLLQLQQAPIEVLAHHFTQAGESLGALFMLEQMANRAQTRGDDRSAALILRRGLELAREELYRGELDDPMRAISIFGRKLGQTLNRLGRFSDAEGVLLEVLDGTPSSEIAQIDVLEGLAVASQRRQKPDSATRYLRQAIAVAERCGDAQQVARLSRALREFEMEAPRRTIESLPAVPSKRSGT
ncbi:MAG TPA: protein kinase [Polyangiaceae bacterium]|jgi:serine/threonine-protein kinase|nr:protein kinase [Polyangiaceae bacterium]